MGVDHNQSGILPLYLPNVLLKPMTTGLSFAANFAFGAFIPLATAVVFRKPMIPALAVGMGTVFAFRFTKGLYNENVYITTMPWDLRPDFLALDGEQKQEFEDLKAKIAANVQ
ncbi:MAG: hypothetical protein MHM6MM_002301 [Cercozoa sp. M6MM]